MFSFYYSSLNYFLPFILIKQKNKKVSNYQLNSPALTDFLCLPILVLIAKVVDAFESFLKRFLLRTQLNNLLNACKYRLSYNTTLFYMHLRPVRGSNHRSSDRKSTIIPIDSIRYHLYRFTVFWEVLH